MKKNPDSLSTETAISEREIVSIGQLPPELPCRNLEIMHRVLTDFLPGNPVTKSVFVIESQEIDGQQINAQEYIYKDGSELEICNFGAVYQYIHSINLARTVFAIKIITVPAHDDINQYVDAAQRDATTQNYLNNFHEVHAHETSWNFLSLTSRVIITVTPWIEGITLEQAAAQTKDMKSFFHLHHQALLALGRLLKRGVHHGNILGRNIKVQIDEKGNIKAIFFSDFCNARFVGQQTVLASRKELHIASECRHSPQPVHDFQSLYSFAYMTLVHVQQKINKGFTTPEQTAYFRQFEKSLKKMLSDRFTERLQFHQAIKLFELEAREVKKYLQDVNFVVIEVKEDKEVDTASVNVTTSTLNDLLKYQTQFQIILDLLLKTALALYTIHGKQEIATPATFHNVEVMFDLETGDVVKVAFKEHKKTEVIKLIAHKYPSTKGVEIKEVFADLATKNFKTFRYEICNFIGNKIRNSLTPGEFPRNLLVKLQQSPSLDELIIILNEGYENCPLLELEEKDDAPPLVTLASAFEVGGFDAVLPSASASAFPSGVSSADDCEDQDVEGGESLVGMSDLSNTSGQSLALGRVDEPISAPSGAEGLGSMSALFRSQHAQQLTVDVRDNNTATLPPIETTPVPITDETDESDEEHSPALTFDP